MLLGISPKHILDNSCFEFKTIVSRNGGQIHKHVAEYHFCKITVCESGIILFTGSIHKMYNSIQGIKAPNYDSKRKEQYKGYNGNQFTLSNIFFIRNHLQEIFECKAEQMKLQNIEFGVNTTPQLNQQKFLNGLLYHKGKRFQIDHNDNFYVAKHQQYRIKIYNKSKQYGMPIPTTRIELSLKKSKKINPLGIFTFADINANTLEKAKSELLKQLNDVIYYDHTIRTKNLSKPLRRLVLNYKNRDFWMCDLKPHHRDRHKKKLQELITNNSDHVKQYFLKDVIKKCVTINRL